MRLPRIAVTMGDPAGVGPELCLRLLSEPEILRDCTPIIFGDAAVLQRVAAHLNLASPLRTLAAKAWPDGWSEIDRATVLDLAAVDAEGVVPGQVNAATGRASYAYIEAAIAAAMNGQVDAVTTGPVHKAALNAAGVPFPGHTEIFAARTDSRRVCMMLTCQALTCSFVTTHVGYRDVPRLLNTSRILDVIQLSNEALTRLRQRPVRMAVCALNPHGGESGLFGDREEERLIVPAIELARSQGIDLEGPLPPDTAFLPERRRVTDCFVCMYHDQGHIPLKALAFDVAVNVTLGLPIVRTSVDHGTALDIAWQNQADLTSLLEAVKLAAKLSRQRTSTVERRGSGVDC